MADPAAPAPVSLIPARNTGFAALSAASAVLLLVVNALIARTLGEDAFGRFNWALTLALFGEALMDLGIHQVTIRAIARDRSQTARLFHNSLALKTVTGVGMFVVMAAISFALARDVALWQASLVMLGVAILRSYLLTIRGVLQGLERFGTDCVVVVGDRLLVLIGVWVAILMGAGLLGVAGAFLCARLLAVGAGLLMARVEAGGLRLSFDVAVWRDLQQEAFPIGMFLLVLNFYSYIDTVMLGVMSTFTDTGLYSSAYRLYEGLSYAPAILSAVLTPRLSRLWRVDRASHRRLSLQGLAAAAGLALVVGAPVWILAQPLLVLVFGPAAAAATTALRLLVAGLGFVFVIWVLHAVALSVFRERLLFTTTVIGAVVNTGLNVFLIPRAGRDGAALATVLGEFLTLVLLVWSLRHTWSDEDHSPVRDAA